MSEYMNSNEAMDWDSIIENDSTFTLLPEGVYPFTVTGFERAYHSGSAKLPACAKAVITVEIDGGTLGKTSITHNLFLHKKTEGLLCDFFTAIGQRKRGEQLAMNWSRVPGATGVCKIGIREWISARTDEKMQSNEIKRFLDPDSSTPSASQGVPAWTPGSF